MHKSRLAGFVIDYKTDDLESAAAFWGGALGMEVRTLPGEQMYAFAAEARTWG
jgi:hypothetical protein